MSTLVYIGFFLFVFGVAYLIWQIVAAIIDRIKKRPSKNRFVKMGIDCLAIIASFFMLSTYKPTKADIQADKKESSISYSKSESKKASISSEKSKSNSQSIANSKSISESKNKAKLEDSKKESESKKVSESKASAKSSSKAESESKAKKESKLEASKKESESKKVSESKASAESLSKAKSSSESKAKASSIAKAESKEKNTKKHKKHKKQSKQSIYDKKAKEIFEDIGGDDSYPLVGHIKVVLNSKNKITGIMVWADESLSTSNTSDLKHYFSAGAQIGNQLLDDKKDKYKVPFIQLYAGNKLIARSQYTNNSQMKDVR
ncbi:DUF308 domain-containing protein [Pediococcus stilesii]|uniref:DUF308 domain-containing protein n=1 Tax=Pediococcus stilesii TaxID=331679 RepID=A0A5R9BXR6_9LACO|nr:DUF308 domain-containing protein [Pediococcus stilesii]TLQ05437.1 DUF308 domain-containing protein [Pediococcus stilesii]